MIRNVKTSKGADAITSDQWHVVHSRFTSVKQGPAFSRGVHSEHDDRVACAKAAKRLRAKLALENADVPAEERDEVFVRKPNFRSLKKARRRAPVAE
jgi:hypothetical protein